jgi:hypothetical protein
MPLANSTAVPLMTCLISVGYKVILPERDRKRASVAKYKLLTPAYRMISCMRLSLACRRIPWHGENRRLCRYGALINDVVMSLWKHVGIYEKLHIAKCIRGYFNI